MTKAAKRIQDGRQKGHSDIICCHFGILIIIEVKKVGEKQTLLQKVTMDEWLKAGAICLVADTLGQVKQMMEELLKARTDLIKEGKI